jgi:hypothetical protein
VLPGDNLVFGGNFRPNPSTGNPNTTVTASQGSIAGLNVPYLNSPALPDQFATSIPYNPALTGAWTLTVQNGADTATVITPSVGMATAPGFITGFSLRGIGTHPTFTWTLPSAVPDSQVIFISDLVTGTPRIIHLVFLSPSATTYTVPVGVLQADTDYWVNIHLEERRTEGTLLSRSRAIFPFRASTQDFTEPIILPFVGPDQIFRFSTSVMEDVMIFIDPPLAIGYDYATGPGDPNFKSVRLPEVADNLYDLYLWRKNAYAFYSTIAANVDVDLAAIVPGGVDRFRILGIEPSAGLDPRDPTAFITGLSFVSTGRFTGTMTPIVDESSTLGPQHKNDCKNGGWQIFRVPRTFKNQGDCIQFVNTGK